MKDTLGWEHKVNPYKMDWLNQYTHGQKILDLGAGQGWYSLYLQEKGFQVTAVDQKLGFHHPQISTLEKSLEEKLPFPNEEFDMILAWDIIEHVKNETQLLQEMHRILKKGGIVLLSVPHADDSRMAQSYLTYAHFKDKTHFREYLPQELEEKFSRLNMQVLRLDLVGGEPYPYVILCFIDNPLVRFITRFYIWLLKKTKFLQIKNCHGDIFAVFKK